MPPAIDLAVASTQAGKLILHRADCPLVRRLADDGVPVLTMLDCKRLPDDSHRMRWHDCLKNK
jgi:hypothetical protein